MNNISKQRKTNVCLEGCLRCIIALIIIVFIFPLFFHQKLLITSKSPDKSYEIIVKYKEAFLFGPQEINVYYKKNKGVLKYHLFTTHLFNDGLPIYESDCKIK
ncbi:MAG: hypothetical protein N4A48_09630 [Tepidibacter sp.]|jgi:hypothetical protein|uniref:hypothetical protein n=1 Tax=Tepidibacter sp. TaxID=2529387 RepID=UPI0025F5E1C1|nr:hypothetical protein [Tepidibacter sp.]MCT4509005.1 hypothetical protein [Tepidibacter sp.]